jgi:hypothetical protein
MLFPNSLQKGNTARRTMLISSTVTCHLHCCMAESYQRERVKKKEFILHTTAATTTMEKNMLSQPKVTAPRVFEHEVDASPSTETIQIYENIHKCIRINFYLSAITLSLSSKFFTPFDVAEDSDWRKCFMR